jgi:CxxC-x17-CxxC domain-containing protein
MGNFNRGGNRGGFGSGGRDGGRPSFGKKPWGGGGDRDRVMYPATCSNCGNHCEVPFRPTNGKPVYCKDCFGEKGGGSNDRFPRNDSRAPEAVKTTFEGPQENNGVKKQLEAMNVKLDRLIQVVNELSRGKSTETKEVVNVSTSPAQVKPVFEKETTKAKSPAKAFPKKSGKKATPKKGKR